MRILSIWVESATASLAPTEPDSLTELCCWLELVQETASIRHSQTQLSPSMRAADGRRVGVRAGMGYKASATTSSTSGIIRLSRPSIPAFNVMVEEGHPLHEPRSSTVTTPFSNER